MLAREVGRSFPVMAGMQVGNCQPSARSAVETLCPDVADCSSKLNWRVYWAAFLGSSPAGF